MSDRRIRGSRTQSARGWNRPPPVLPSVLPDQSLPASDAARPVRVRHPGQAGKIISTTAASSGATTLG